MKMTVYVEGQSEMLFVADVLQKYSHYDPSECGFHCINLVADCRSKISYPVQGDFDSAKFYQIINANCDTQVNSRLKKDAAALVAKGYDMVVGLRDVYGDEYKCLTSDRIVYYDKIDQLHKFQTAAINHSGVNCRLHYAVMEFEAWMLALIENYIVSKGFEPAEVLGKRDIAADCEPELIYHPYPLIQKIFEDCGASYHKHQGDTYSFLSTLGKDDYERLRRSGRCPSFTLFMNSLLGEA